MRRWQRIPGAVRLALAAAVVIAVTWCPDLVPVVAGFALLLLGLYPGERTIHRLLTSRVRRPRPRAVAASALPRAPLVVGSGLRLLADGLARRGPPVPVA